MSKGKKVVPRFYAAWLGIENIRERVDILNGEVEKIEYLKMMLDNLPVEKAWNYYCHERAMQDCPAVWRGIFDSRSGERNGYSQFSGIEREAYKHGQEFWKEYCKVKQLIKDIESGEFKSNIPENPGDTITHCLAVLSKKWKGSALMEEHDFKRLVIDIRHIESTTTLPSVKQFKKINSGQSLQFYTYTIYTLWKNLHRAKDGSQPTWKEYIVASFRRSNPEMTVESLSKVFSKKPHNYTQDLENLK